MELITEHDYEIRRQIIRRLQCRARSLNTYGDDKNAPYDGTPVRSTRSKHKMLSVRTTTRADGQIGENSIRIMETIRMNVVRLRELCVCLCSAN